MDLSEYLSAMRADGNAILAAARHGFDLPIPPCPGWDMGELVWHLGEVHYFWTTVAERRLDNPENVKAISRPSDAELLGWFANGLEWMLEVLGSADPAAPVWTWTPKQKDVAFVQRRMAQETAVHRWDAEVAVAAADADTTVSPIPAQLAEDGVEEFVDHFLPFAEGRAHHVELIAHPSGRRWRIGAEREPAVTIAAPASTLLLALWRRVPLHEPSVLVTGDAAAADRFIHATPLD